jgi:hypothetical protein
VNKFYAFRIASQAIWAPACIKIKTKVILVSTKINRNIMEGRKEKRREEREDKIPPGMTRTLICLGSTSSNVWVTVASYWCFDF